MKIEIQAAPRFWICLTVEHVNVLKKCAEWHYDATCNDAARLGGFIFGWNNVVTPYPGMEETPKCVATYRDLDLSLKILEIGGSIVFPDEADQALVAEMRKSFNAALRMSNNVMGDIIFHVE